MRKPASSLSECKEHSWGSRLLNSVPKPCRKGNPMSEESSLKATWTIPSPDPSCPLLSRHQLGSPANRAAHTCSQRERSPEHSPKRDAAGVSCSLLFHPPFLHIVRTRVPPRVQRPQAEPEPVTPGCNEGRGARNLSRGRNTVAMLSRPGPHQLRHPDRGKGPIRSTSGGGGLCPCPAHLWL